MQGCVPLLGSLPQRGSTRGRQSLAAGALPPAAQQARPLAQKRARPLGFAVHAALTHFLLRRNTLGWLPFLSVVQRAASPAELQFSGRWGSSLLGPAKRHAALPPAEGLVGPAGQGRAGPLAHPPDRPGPLWPQDRGPPPGPVALQGRLEVTAL